MMIVRSFTLRRAVTGLVTWPILAASVLATPANRSALKNHYDRFLPEALNRCTTCHLPSSLKDPQNLDEFPHNPFGRRLRALGEELSAKGKSSSLATRLELVAAEDADGDGVPNQVEILLGTNPGDAKDTPDPESLKKAPQLEAELHRLLNSYRWQPFETVRRPDVPAVKNAGWLRNEIDNFISAEHEQRGLTPRPEAPKEVLLRRVYVDLVGLQP